MPRAATRLPCRAKPPPFEPRCPVHLSHKLAPRCCAGAWVWLARLDRSPAEGPLTRSKAFVGLRNAIMMYVKGPYASDGWAWKGWNGWSEAARWRFGLITAADRKQLCASRSSERQTERPGEGCMPARTSRAPAHPPPQRIARGAVRGASPLRRRSSSNLSVRLPVGRAWT